MYVAACLHPYEGFAAGENLIPTMRYVVARGDLDTDDGVLLSVYGEKVKDVEEVAFFVREGVPVLCTVYLATVAL